MMNFIFSLESIINDNILGVPRRWLTYYIQLWLRPLVVIVVLLIAALLGFKGSSRIFMVIPVLLVGVGVVLMFMRWPSLGLVALMATIAIPMDGPSGSNATMALVALLLGLWVLDMMVRQRKIDLLSSLPIKPLLALILVASLAFGFGQVPWYTFAQSAPVGAQLGGLSLYILSAAAFLLVAHQIQDVRWLQVMTWVYIGVASIYIFGQLLSLRIVNPFYVTVVGGSLFWTWLVTLAFSQAAFNQKLHPGWRLLLLVIAAATFYIAFVQRNDWKSGWVPALASVAAMIGFRFWRLGVFLAPFGIPPASYLATAAIASDQYSYSTRVEAWLIVIEITKANPILGLGFANYNWFAPLFPIRGYAVRFNSHSQIVDIVAQTGLVGLACFLWFFGAVGWLGWQLRERVAPGFAQAYVYGALGGLVGTLTAAVLGDWVLPFFYNVGLRGFRSSVLSWVFLGGLVALEQITRKSDRAEVVD